MDDSSEWRRALAPLREGTDPPAALEERVVSALLAASTPRRSMRRLTRLAAAVALLALGVLAGRWSTRDAALPDGPRYMLLLYEGAGFDQAPAAHDLRVEEYRAWARTLAGEGKLVDGAELDPESRVLGGAESALAPAGVIAGYFIIQARNPAEAASIAAGCPHLKHGGTVAIRPIRT